MIVKYISGKIIIDNRAREWCKLPYPNHPRGCPNFNKKDTCPPKMGYFKDYFNVYKPIYLVAIPFNIREHINKMKNKHPHWTNRQCRCVLYWQGKVRKQLRIVMEEVMNKYHCDFKTDCPEAMGVNVIKTAKNVGIPISAKIKDIVYKIGFIGDKKKEFGGSSFDF